MEVANRSNEDFLRPPVHRVNHNLESVIYSVKGVLTRQVTAFKGWLTRQVAINPVAVEKLFLTKFAKMKSRQVAL